MIGRTMRGLLLAGLIGVTVLSTGCLKETDTLTVFPDGSGTIRLQRKLGNQLSGMITGFAKDDKGKAEAVDKTLYDDLAKWEGVSCWSGCKAALESGCIVTDAIGYFDDVRKVRHLAGEDEVESLTWAKNDDGGFTLTWIEEKKKDKSLEFTDEESNMLKQFGEMAKDMRVEKVAVLPGAVGACAGTTDQKGRAATFAVTGDDVMKFLGMVGEYKKRVVAGEITKEKANAEVKEKQKPLALHMSVTCAPGEVDAEAAQFQKDYKAAATGYAESETAKKVEASKKKK